jgi:hypothetical protein
VSKETVRQWMAQAGLRKTSRRLAVEVHEWRPRRSRCGELVQWDTSMHDWLEGSGEQTYLIAMIDDATIRLFARFVRHDSSEGRDRPGDAADADCAGLARDGHRLDSSALAAGQRARRAPVSDGTGSTGERHAVAGVRTTEAANAYLEKEYLPWWNQTLTVRPADAAGAHRPLGKDHDLTAILSHVEPRQVANDYTVRYRGRIFQTHRQDIRVGMRKAMVRVEERLDGTIAVRFQDRYVRVRRGAESVRALPPAGGAAAQQPHPAQITKRKSDWMKNFSIRSAASLRQASQVSNARS